MPRLPITGIKKLLRVRDLASIHQGVELLRSLDDPSVAEKLLEKTSLVEKPVKAGCTDMPEWQPSALGISWLQVQQLKLGAPFTAASKVRGFGEHAAREVINLAPSRFEQAESFLVSAVGLSEVDLGTLAAFKNVQTLVLWGLPEKTTGWEVFASLPVRHLVVGLSKCEVGLTEGHRVESITMDIRSGEIGAHTGQTVRSWAFHPDPSPPELEQLTGAESIRIDPRQFTRKHAEALASLPKLKQFRLHGSVRWCEGYQGLVASRSLEELSISVPNVDPDELRGFVGHPTLRKLRTHTKVQNRLPELQALF